MRKSKGYDALIQAENLDEILTKLKKLEADTKVGRSSTDVIPIMLDQTIRRALYKSKGGNEHGDTEIHWIRIMEGDIDYIGETRCTITYKIRRKDMSSEYYSELRVESFDDAAELFELIGYVQTSYQENKRSKFVCVVDKVRYMVRFDVWPKLEDVIFVNVVCVSSASQEDIDGFIKLLGLNQIDLAKEEAVADVDAEYQKRGYKPARFMPEVTFDSFKAE
ncbi:MAG: hypothetical protein FWC41_04205 [Firmicutes bacterium]|nr:hypothetical protein [Bacillota bacterium]